MMPPFVQNLTSHKWFKMTKFGSTCFGELLSGFGAQGGCFGARVSFGMQNYVYIGPRVAFR